MNIIQESNIRYKQENQSMNMPTYYKFSYILKHFKIVFFSQRI